MIWIRCIYHERESFVLDLNDLAEVLHDLIESDIQYDVQLFQYFLTDAFIFNLRIFVTTTGCHKFPQQVYEEHSGYKVDEWSAYDYVIVEEQVEKGEDREGM